MSEIWFMVSFMNEVSTVEIVKETAKMITRKDNSRSFKKRSKDWHNFFKTAAELEEFLEGRIKEKETEIESLHNEINFIEEQIGKLRRQYANLLH